MSSAKTRAGRWWLLTTLVVLAVVVACVLFCRGRRGGETAEVPPVTERMQDEVYMTKLRAQEDEQKNLMSAKVRVERELAEARAEDPEGTGARVKELEAAEKGVYEAFERNRQRTMDLVRERMQRQTTTTTNLK